LAFHQNKFPPNLTFFLSAKINSAKLRRFFCFTKFAVQLEASKKKSKYELALAYLTFLRLLCKCGSGFIKPINEDHLFLDSVLTLFFNPDILMTRLQS